jgi:calcineurin-like phosphoesterase family protein
MIDIINKGDIMIYFTADHHDDHDEIIQMCNRPFYSRKHMRKEMIKRHNEKVTESDTVYFIGDVSFSRDKEPIRRFIEKLNGIKHLILGNHDSLKPFDYVELGFTTVHTALEISTFLGDFVLVHDPAISQIDRDRMFLCGHIHDLFIKQKNCINIGVDVWDFYPVSLQQIKELMETKNE